MVEIVLPVRKGGKNTDLNSIVDIVGICHDCSLSPYFCSTMFLCDFLLCVSMSFEFQ